MTESKLLCTLINERATFLRVAQNVVGCRCDAEDVLQDVALKAWRIADDEVIENPRIYLRRMVLNWAIDHARRARLQSLVSDPDLSLANVAEPGVCPHARLEACQSLHAVASTIRAMPPRMRHVFLAHRMGGEPQNVIAARCRVSLTLINVLVRDATAQCRKAVG